MPRPVAPGPEARVLPGVPVRQFGLTGCGAGSLSAVLNHLGDPVSFEELDALLPRGRNEGVLTIDLVLEARRRGFDAELVEGDAAAAERELLAGRPVILMLKVLEAPGVERDLYHYVVLDGIDEQRGLVRVQLGEGEPRWTTLERLDTAWRPARRTMIVVRHGDAPAVLPGARAIRWAVALEAEGRTDEAVALYRRLVEQEPTSALLWTNLGNAEAARGRTVEAEVAYRQALAIDDGAADALNNLAWVLVERGAAAEAEALARRALASGPPDRHLAYHTLGRSLAELGRCRDAAEALAAGLEAAPAEAVAAREWLRLDLALAQRDCGDGGWEEALTELAATATDPEVRHRLDRVQAPGPGG